MPPLYGPLLLASESAKTVAVSGYRYTWPPTEVNGAMVTQILGAKKKNWNPTTYPADRLVDTPLADLGFNRCKVEKANYQLNRDLKLTAACRVLLDSL